MDVGLFLRAADGIWKKAPEQREPGRMGQLDCPVRVLSSRESKGGGADVFVGMPLGTVRREGVNSLSRP